MDVMTIEISVKLDFCINVWLVCSRICRLFVREWCFFARLAFCDHLSGTTHPKLNKALTIHLWWMGLCASGWWITVKDQQLELASKLTFSLIMPLVFLFWWPNTLGSQSLAKFPKTELLREGNVCPKALSRWFFVSLFFSLPYTKNKTHSSLALLWQDDNFLLAGDVCMMAVDCSSALFQVQSCIEHFGTDFEISWFTWDTLHFWPLNHRFYHIPSQALLKIKHCKWIAPLSLFLHRVLYHFFHGATIAILLSGSKWF